MERWSVQEARGSARQWRHTVTASCRNPSVPWHSRTVQCTLLEYETPLWTLDDGVSLPGRPCLFRRPDVQYLADLVKAYARISCQVHRPDRVPFSSPGPGHCLADKIHRRPKSTTTFHIGGAAAAELYKSRFLLPITTCGVVGCPVARQGRMALAVHLWACDLWPGVWTSVLRSVCRTPLDDWLYI